MRIAIVDSGIDSNYYSDNDCFIGYKGYDYYDDEIVENSEIHDAFGHGTECADCIHQLMPDAEIYVVRILDDEGNTSAEMLSRALDELADVDVDIVNLSLSLTDSNEENLRAVCRKLNESGKIITASVQNGKTTSVPASFDEVIGVIGGLHESPHEYYWLKDSDVDLVCDCMPMMVKSAGNFFDFFSGNSKATCVATVLIAEAMIKMKENNADCALNKETVMDFIRKNRDFVREAVAMEGEIPCLRDEKEIACKNKEVLRFLIEQFTELLECTEEDLQNDRLIDVGFFSAQDIYDIILNVNEKFNYNIKINNFTYLNFEWFWCFVEYVDNYIVGDDKK